MQRQKSNLSLKDINKVLGSACGVFSSWSCQTCPLLKNEQIAHWWLSPWTKMVNFGLIGIVRLLHAVCQWGYPDSKFRWTDSCDISQLNFQLQPSLPLQLPTVSRDGRLTAPANDEGLSWIDWRVFIACSLAQRDWTCKVPLNLSGTHYLALYNTNTQHLLQYVPATLQGFNRNGRKP